MTRPSLHIGVLSLVCFAWCSAATANGLHLGWCNGVGNNHQSVSCDTSGAGGSTPTIVDVPRTNEITPSLPPVQPSPAEVTADIIVIEPQAPVVVTGMSPVVPVTGQTGIVFKGIGQQQITVTPEPSAGLIGTSPVLPFQTVQTPSFTGIGQQTVVIQPNPPTTFTGTTPRGNVLGVSGPSFTGVGMPIIIVQPEPPTTLTGVGPVPATIIVQPNPRGSFVGGAIPAAVPQATPGRIPNQVPQVSPQRVPGMVPTLAATPQPVPGQVPQAVPQPVPGMVPALVAAPQSIPNQVRAPTPTPVLVPRPKPLVNPPVSVTAAANSANTGAGVRPRPRPNATGSITVSHSPAPVSQAAGHRQITQTSGRQAPHDLPAFASENGGNDWRCLASGHGRRTAQLEDKSTSNGALRHIGSIDVLGRDLPALHPGHSGCIVSVQRRRDN